MLLHKSIYIPDTGIIISNEGEKTENNLSAPEEPLANDTNKENVNTYENAPKTGDNSIVFLLFSAVLICILRKNYKAGTINN